MKAKEKYIVREVKQFDIYKKITIEVPVGCIMLNVLSIFDDKKNGGISLETHTYMVINGKAYEVAK